LGTPADVRWVASDLKMIIFIVNMCNKGGGPPTNAEVCVDVLRRGKVAPGDFWLPPIIF
jgi:hypothetical protein